MYTGNKTIHTTIKHRNIETEGDETCRGTDQLSWNICSTNQCCANSVLFISNCI